MAADFPYLYPYSRADARRLRQTQMHEDSFRVNVDCARAIEQAVRDHFNAAQMTAWPTSEGNHVNVTHMQIDTARSEGKNSTAFFSPMCLNADIH